MVIDFHAHVYPEKIAAKAVAGIGDFYHVKMQGDGTAEGLINNGKPAGIDRFVVFSAAANPSQVIPINDYIASICRDHKEFTGFGTLHYDMDDPVSEMDRLIGLGLKGLKFHPDMQSFFIDDIKMMKIYAAAEGRIPLIFHTGDYRYDFSHPSRLAKVLDIFPGLRVIAAHFGGWSVFDIAYDHLKDKNCFFDVSSSLPFLGLRRARELIRAYGAERILFGSDYPMWNPAGVLQEFMKIDLDDNEREMILCSNARKLVDN